MTATFKNCDLKRKTALVLSGSGKDFESSIASPVKAIRAKCLDCCAGSVVEVRECPVAGCPLHPYRMGRNPFRQKRKLSADQIARLRSGLDRARKCPPSQSAPTDSDESAS